MLTDMNSNASAILSHLSLLLAGQLRSNGLKTQFDHQTLASCINHETSLHFLFFLISSTDKPKSD